MCMLYISSASIGQASVQNVSHKSSELKTSLDSDKVLVLVIFFVKGHQVLRNNAFWERCMKLKLLEKRDWNL